jgi:hypothetical protein
MRNLVTYKFLMNGSVRNYIYDEGGEPCWYGVCNKYQAFTGNIYEYSGKDKQIFTLHNHNVIMKACLDRSVSVKTGFMITYQSICLRLWVV